MHALVFKILLLEKRTAILHREYFFSFTSPEPMLS